MSLGTGVLGLGATIIQFDIWLFTKKETNDFFFIPHRMECFYESRD